MPAEVTNYGTSDFAATIDISVGRSQGVQLNMPVVGAGGLVGQVVQANHSTATVRLITDGQSLVGRPLRAAPGALAVLTGEGSGKPLDADLVPTNTPLAAGERVHHQRAPGGQLPGRDPGGQRGLRQERADASQKSVALQPVADLAHLRYVSVVLSFGPSP